MIYKEPHLLSGAGKLKSPSILIAFLQLKSPCNNYEQLIRNPSRIDTVASCDLSYKQLPVTSLFNLIKSSKK